MIFLTLKLHNKTRLHYQLIENLDYHIDYQNNRLECYTLHLNIVC